MEKADELDEFRNYDSEKHQDMWMDGKLIRIHDMKTGKKRRTGYITKDMIYKTWRSFPRHFFRMNGGYNISKLLLEDLIQKGVKNIYLDERRRFCKACNRVISHVPKDEKGREIKFCKKCNNKLGWVVFRTFIVTPTNWKFRSVPYSHPKFEPQLTLKIEKFDKIIE